MVTSQLATEIAKLDEQSLADIFRSAVSKSQLTSLHAVYAFGKPSVLGRPTLSSLSYVSTTIEEHELCTAARNGSSVVIQFLTEQGVSTNATDAAGRGALHNCAAHGNIESARLLLGKGADVNSIRRGGSPLHCAVDSSCRSNMVEMMHLLLDYNADLTSRDRDDETVLYRACGAGLIRRVELLLEKGAPIEDRQNGMTALMIASRNRRAVTAQLLLERGADVNSVLPTTGHDSLCLAVIGCDTWGRDSSRFQLEWTIKSLVKYGADINGNAQKSPPLSLALSGDLYLRYATVGALLNAGARIEKPDSKGFTPLETWILESTWYDTSVLHLLLTRGVNVNRLNVEHKSPLAQVCGAATLHLVDLRVSVIQMLLQHEADVNQTDRNGDTPAMIMIMNATLSPGHKIRLLQLLFDNGANPWLENRDRETLLVKAMKYFGLETQERRKVLNLILHYQGIFSAGFGMSMSTQRSPSVMVRTQPSPGFGP